MTINWPAITVEVSFDSLLLRKTVAEQGANWTDITTYVLRWGYSRGRQRQLGRAEVGTAEITLDNSDGRFDPENNASPYYNGHASEDAGLGMTPRRHVRIRATYGGVTYGLFYGYVTAWEPRELDRSTSPTVRLSLEDILGWIGRGEDWRIGTTSLRPGLAIYNFLTSTDVAFTTSLLDIDDGTVATVGLSVTVYNLLSKIQEYAETEPGAVFFVDGDGHFVFHDRQRRFIYDRSVVAQAKFDGFPTAQTEGALPYSSVVYKRDLVTYANLVTVTSGAAVGATPQTAESILGVNRYGPRDMVRSSRLSNNAWALVVAKTLLEYHNRFDGVHETLTVDLGGGSAALTTALLRLAISDKIRVTERLFPGVRSRTIDSFIEGMSVTVDHERLSWRTTYRLSRAYPDLFPTIGGKGVAFPSNPIVNDVFLRTDLGLLCFYDGTRWLTVSEYTAAFSNFDNTSGVFTITSFGGLMPAPEYSVSITKFDIRSTVTSLNNGSNYWTINLIADGATIVSHSTAANGLASVVQRASPNSIISPVDYLTWQAVKVGSPGTMYIGVTCRYRLIIS